MIRTLVVSFFYFQEVFRGPPNQLNSTDHAYLLYPGKSELNGSFYIGGARVFKNQGGNHMQTFKNKEIQQVCALKDFIWDLKERKINFEIKWSIIKQSRACKSGDKNCHLCVTEKLCVMENSRDSKLINKDIHNMDKCLHKSKFLVKNWKRKKFMFKRRDMIQSKIHIK